MIRELTADEALEVRGGWGGDEYGGGGSGFDPYSWSPTPQSPASLVSLNTSLTPIGLGPVYGSPYYPPTNSSPPFSVSGSLQGGFGLSLGLSGTVGPSISSTGQSCFNATASFSVIGGWGVTGGVTASWCDR